MMLNVTCAIIRDEDRRVLVVQRNETSDHPYRWEFPGGKIRDGESEEDCVLREISEELSMIIVIYEKLEPVEYDYGQKKVRLIPFVCDTLDDLPVLTEHLDFKWLKTGELLAADLCEADILVAEEFLVFTGTKVESTTEANERCTDDQIDEDFRTMVSRITSTKEAEWLAVSALDNPAMLRKLIDYSFQPDKKIAFHSSWTITKICDRAPELIYPFLDEIAERLDSLENDSARRSFLRIFSLTDLDKLNNRNQGILADYCFVALNSGFSSIAAKAYSMEILYKLTKKYPELGIELSASIRMLHGEGSSGVKARGQIILRKLAGITDGQSEA